MASDKTLVIRNGILIDGSGKPAARNETIVIEGNRIKSVGPLPRDVALEDRRNEKDGKTVDLDPRDAALMFQQAAE
jgi:N-acyl-D-aspartate/D-glutamate deacylase